MKTRKVTIAAGTLSKKKLQYLKNTLKKFKIDAEVVAVEVSSEISHQPENEKVTMRGSTNRARNALRKVPEATFGLGIEMGGDFNKAKKRETFCYASIVDRDGKVYSARSFGLKQPKIYADILKQGKILGEFRHDFRNNKKHKGHIYEYLGSMLEYRKPFIVNALEKVLIYYYCRDEFE
jgi:non-canonical (house-cleaning) NTP pyrophosphatase